MIRKVRKAFTLLKLKTQMLWVHYNLGRLNAYYVNELRTNKILVYQSKLERELLSRLADLRRQYNQVKSQTPQ